jgi:hypothetical protein
MYHIYDLDVDGIAPRLSFVLLHRPANTTFCNHILPISDARSETHDMGGVLKAELILVAVCNQNGSR